MENEAFTWSSQKPSECDQDSWILQENLCMSEALWEKTRNLLENLYIHPFIKESPQAATLEGGVTLKGGLTLKGEVLGETGGVREFRRFIKM